MEGELTYHISDHTISRVKHGSEIIMLQGCFSSAGPMRLVRLDRKMYRAKNRTILEEIRSQAALDLRMGHTFTFQEDSGKTWNTALYQISNIYI